jgi:hypothetical protein
VLICELICYSGKDANSEGKGHRHGSRIAPDDDQVCRPLLKRARRTGAALLCNENREEAAWRSRAKNS